MNEIDFRPGMLIAEESEDPVLYYLVLHSTKEEMTIQNVNICREVFRVSKAGAYRRVA
jgi:hypothetical protein